MSVSDVSQAAALVRAISRATVRILATVTVAYTLIAAVTVLSRSQDFLAWICIVSTVGFIASLPAVLVARASFGRRLREADVALAERLGFFGRLNWVAADKLAGTEAFIGFVLRGDFRKLKDRSLQRAAIRYATAHCISIALGAAMVGGFLVIVSLALSLLPTF